MTKVSKLARLESRMNIKLEITLFVLLLLLLGGLSLEPPISWPPKFKNPLKLSFTNKEETDSSPKIDLPPGSPIKLALPNDPDPRLPKDKKIYAFAGSSSAVAFVEAKLPAEGIIETQIDEQPFVLYVDKATPWIVGFIPILEGKKLNLVKEGAAIRDLNSKSLFDPKTGMATDGPLKGRSLSSVVGRITTWGPWSTVYPETKVWPLDAPPPLSEAEVNAKIQQVLNQLRGNGGQTNQANLNPATSSQPPAQPETPSSPPEPPKPPLEEPSPESKPSPPAP